MKTSQEFLLLMTMEKKTNSIMNNSITIVVICVLLTAFFFSTMEVALKLAASGMDSLQLTFLRFLIGGLILLPFGGLSCIAQTYTCIRDTGLSLWDYIQHKLYLTAITACYYFFLRFLRLL